MDVQIGAQHRKHWCRLFERLQQENLKDGRAERPVPEAREHRVGRAEVILQRLADFKVPRKIVFLPEIPKGATGKLQRIGLAAKLGLTG